jgi:hypothetical protein
LVYSHAIATAAIPGKSRGLAHILAWRRVRFVLIVCALFGVLLNFGNQAPPPPPPPRWGHLRAV